MSVKSLTNRITYLTEQITALKKENDKLRFQLTETREKQTHILPKGMYLEQAPSGQLILHVPAERTYFPVTLDQDPFRAINSIQRIFNNQKVLPHQIGSDAVPTDSVLKEWWKDGGRVSTDRKLKLKDFNP